MSVKEAHRIVVRRKRLQGGAHPGGNWKIAYADFVTAMMAFFLVLWLISITSAGEREGIAEYFRTPLRVALTGGDRAATSASAIPGGGTDPTRVDGEVRRADPSTQSRQHAEEQRDRRRLENLRQRLENLIEQNPVLRQYRPQMLIDMTSEGLRIQIVDDRNRPMFATGRAEVEPHMRAILREIGPLLNDLPNKISLAGHTDAVQYQRGEKAYSNWELSADRANASRRELLAGGMHESKLLRVMGLGSTMNMVKDDPFAAVNRRISLVVLNQRTQRRIELENASAADIQAASARGAIDAATADPQAASEAAARGVPAPAAAPSSNVSD